MKTMHEAMAPRPDRAAIQTLGLAKRFGAVRALVDVDLVVHPGEVFGFLGPNGAGKTTLIRVLLDEVRPTAGSATILGMDCRRDSVAIRRHLGYVPGDLALYPNLTGRETLAYFANLRGGVDWAHVDELAGRFGADLTRRVGELSSGNRQKIGLIQALMNRPQILIMDEPSAGLDPLLQRELQRVLREAVAEGRTVFLSSHTLSEVERVADRIGIIRDGRLVAVEAVSALRSKAIRRVELELRPEPDRAALTTLLGVREVVIDGGRASLSYDGKLGPLLATVAERFEVVDVTTHEADLEEIFLAYYRTRERVV